MPRPTPQQIQERETLQQQGLKKCSKCGDIKPPSEFRNKANSWDGLSASCRECLKPADQRWSEMRDPDAKRQADKKWRESNREAIAEKASEKYRRNKRNKEDKPPVDQRSALRKAIDENDYDTVVSELKARTTPVGECWESVYKDRRGYGAFSYNQGRGKKRRIPLHRLMYEAYHRVKLSSSQVVHHTCSNRACINPEHLQMIDQHSNVAEMLERRYYQERIAELEAALQEATTKSRKAPRRVPKPSDPLTGVQLELLVSA